MERKYGALGAPGAILLLAEPQLTLAELAFLGLNLYRRGSEPCRTCIDPGKLCVAETGRHCQILTQNSRKGVRL
jgi:hypothetical protein